MASLDRRLRWLAARAKERPLLVVVGFACVAALLLEVGSLTNFFGLADRHSSPALPDLNPHQEKILSITSFITYYGTATGYFPSLENGTNLCGPTCPKLPQLWVPKQGSLPPEIGVYFYFNVTNTAAVDKNLSVPIVTTSGPEPTLFFLETFCCYTTVEPAYDELVDSEVTFLPDFTFGFMGYAYTTVPLPAVEAGGYELNVSYTSS